MKTGKPIIGITMGDPASIGPEIAVKALLNKHILEICNPVIIGDAAVFNDIINRLGIDAKINPVKNIKDAGFIYGQPDVYDLQNVDMTQLRFGEITLEANAIRDALEILNRKLRIPIQFRHSRAAVPRIGF